MEKSKKTIFFDHNFAIVPGKIQISKVIIKLQINEIHDAWKVKDKILLLFFDPKAYEATGKYPELIEITTANDNWDNLVAAFITDIIISYWLILFEAIATYFCNTKPGIIDEIFIIKVEDPVFKPLYVSSEMGLRKWENFGLQVSFPENK